MSLTDDQLERYARHIVLREIGGAGQQKLLQARVVVVGAGGLGSPCIQYLAAAGVGHLTILDDDIVDLSNLQRQTLFGTGDIGRPKVEVARLVVERLNPDVSVEARQQRVAPENVAALLANHDIVVDGTDSFPTRFAVAEATQKLRIPLVSAAVGPFEGQVATYRGWEVDKPCYRCLVGDEPGRPDTSCADQGVLGALTGVIGSLAALETIRQISGFGPDSAGKLFLFDAMSLRARTVTLPKNPGCGGCGAT